MVDIKATLDKLEACYPNVNRNRVRERVRERDAQLNELSHGVHMGYEWYTAHNELGYRNGYVRVTKSHPWFGKHMSMKPIVAIDVHGGITYTEKGPPLFVPRFSYQWWLGFDCGHAGDAPDIDLIPDDVKAAMEIVNGAFTLSRSTVPSEGLGSFFTFMHEQGVVRSQEYVEQECKRLAEQAFAAHEAYAWSTV